MRTTGGEGNGSADARNGGGGAGPERMRCDWRRLELTVEESGESKDGLHCGNVKEREGVCTKGKL